MSVKGFVAYPSEPPALAETVEYAVQEINQGGAVALTTWKQLAISGKLLSSEICKAIDGSPLFVADITNQNYNVLFELGYAIALRKRIWLLQDRSTDLAKERYEKVRVLKTIGHSEYTNSTQIIGAFYRDAPHESLQETAFKHLIQPLAGQTESVAHVLYLKSYTPTEASNRLSRAIDRANLKPVTDDPSESSPETLDWYVRHLYGTQALLAHMGSDSVSKAAATNAKYALVAGLAYGMGKSILMLGEMPYSCPVDYELLLRTHETAAQCVRYADEWLAGVLALIRDRQHGERVYHEVVTKRQFIASLRLGEHVAENEVETLPEYFVETGPYLEALRSKMCLFVGRKGTGKTANLYRIAHEYSKDRRNHVCVVKPLAYDTEGVLNRLKNIRPKAEMGGVYESLWKYLVYSELCLSVSEELKEKAVGTLTPDEQAFLDFCSACPFDVGGDFSIRLQRRVEVIESDVVRKWDGQTPVRLAEHLHAGVIPEMRHQLGRALADKNKVVVLVDNLDKAWKTREDIDELCDLLLGFLTVMSSISVDFGKQEHWRKAIPLSLIAFLRSDIYSHLVRRAREPDKMTVVRVAWEDADLLLRVIASRFMFTNERLSEPDVWTRIFPEMVGDAPVKEYIAHAIYPRPRDAIVLAKSALSRAISRGHESITASDLEDARKEYSEYAFNSVNVEDANSVGSIENGTYALIGGDVVMTDGEIRCRFSKEQIADEVHDALIRGMCRLSVLGLETGQGEFTYVYDDADLDRILKLAQVYADKSGRRRYRVHPALCPQLGMECS